MSWFGRKEKKRINELEEQTRQKDSSYQQQLDNEKRNAANNYQNQQEQLNEANRKLRELQAQLEQIQSRKDNAKQIEELVRQEKLRVSHMIRIVKNFIEKHRFAQKELDFKYQLYPEGSKPYSDYLDSLKKFKKERDRQSGNEYYPQELYKGVYSALQGINYTLSSIYEVFIKFSFLEKNLSLEVQENDEYLEKINRFGKAIYTESVYLQQCQRIPSDVKHLENKDWNKSIFDMIKGGWAKESHIKQNNERIIEQFKDLINAIGNLRESLIHQKNFKGSSISYYFPEYDPILASLISMTNVLFTNIVQRINTNEQLAASLTQKEISKLRELEEATNVFIKRESDGLDLSKVAKRKQ